MTKKKLFDDISRDPARFYRIPGDVLRDRRFTAAEKLEILRAWRRAGDGAQIDAMISDLEDSFTAGGHAAE